MSQEKVSRLMQQIDSQHQALCADYLHLRDTMAVSEDRLERIAHTYWQLRSQISSLTDTGKVEIEFR